MIKISDYLKRLINHQPYLLFGLKNRLFNLSKLAKFLHPYIESHTQKKVSQNSITMSLSRLQRKIKRSKTENKFNFKNIVTCSNLSSVTFIKKYSTYRKILSFYESHEEEASHITIIHGINEITVITSDELISELMVEVKSKPKTRRDNLSSISIHFDEKYSEQPGLMFFSVQQVTFQNINIYEIASTYTEITFYIDKKDVNKAFEIFNNLVDKNTLAF